MINDGAAVADARLNVLEGIVLSGQVNVSEDVLLANVRHAIRLPYPQVKPHAMQHDRVAIVGGGPSLNDTEDELVELIRDGAKLVTLNGAYHWCLERNLFPKTQIVVDARPSNARFVEPAIPKCNYLIASQCAPELWSALEGRPNVWMFHAASGTDGPLRELLDAHYLGQWFGVGGGTTSATRAISVLRTLGYVRFDLFGVDSCFLNGAHHAYAQPENEKDKPVKITVEPINRPDLRRDFDCAPWHIKQAEDALQMIRVNGENFLINVHGDGLIAYMLASSAAGEINIGPA